MATYATPAAAAPAGVSSSLRARAGSPLRSKPLAAPKRGGGGKRSTLRVAAVSTPAKPSGGTPKQDFDWDNLGFGLVETSFMYRTECAIDGEWTKGTVVPYGNLSMHPSAAVLNYGQGIFEGMKAFRTAGSDDVVVFRPDQNAARFAEGAGRMSMPPVPADVFIDAVKKCVSANREWVPPEGKGSLYLRPLLIGSGPILGLGPAPSYTFLIYCSPVASYFKGGKMAPIDLTVEETYHRAAPGGTGSTKCIGNYSPVLKVQLAAKKAGFSDVIYLDAVENKYIEEVSSCNFFCVKGKTIATPALGGSILPGITRKSIIDIARAKGFTVEERNVSVEEVLEADECFCCGTAVVVVPVGSITVKGEKTQFQGGKTGPVAQEMYDELTGIQSGKVEGPEGWLEVVPEEYHL